MDDQGINVLVLLPRKNTALICNPIGTDRYTDSRRTAQLKLRVKKVKIEITDKIKKKREKSRKKIMNKTAAEKDIFLKYAITGFSTEKNTEVSSYLLLRWQVRTRLEISSLLSEPSLHLKS